MLQILAENDREAFLEHAQIDGEWRPFSLKALVGASLGKDLIELIQVLESKGVKPEEGWELYREWRVGSGVTYEEVGEEFLKSYNEIPSAWLSSLGTFYRASELQWLTFEKFPGMETSELRGIQESLTNDGMGIAQKQREAFAHLVMEGEWLSDEVRTNLAERVVWAFGDWKQADAWVKSIPPQFQTEARKTVDYFLDQIEIRKKQWELKNPETLIRTILESREEFLDLKLGIFSDEEISKLIEDLRGLSSEETLLLFRKVWIGEFPRPVFHQLVSKIARIEEIADERSPGRIDFNHALTTLARQLGEEEPLAAAEWALTLPEGISRNRALSSIFDEWKKYDEAEALEWAKVLSPEEREKLGLE